MPSAVGRASGALEPVDDEIEPVRARVRVVIAGLQDVFDGELGEE